MLEKLLSGFFGKAEVAAKNTEMISTLNPYIGRRGLLGAMLIAAGVGGACCGKPGGGGGKDPVPPKDTIAPGAIVDLAAYASTQYGERVTLEFTQPGDDNYTGTPKEIMIRISDVPITSQAEWDNAYDISNLTGADVKVGGSNRTLEFDLSQIAALVTDGMNFGDLYFSVRVKDEANNISTLSNSPTEHVPSKAEFYVDKWLPEGSVYLNYLESVAMVQGEAGVNPSYASDLAAEMIQCNPVFPGTATDLANLLSEFTDQIYAPPNGELYSGWDSFYLDADLIGSKKVRLYGEPTGGIIDFDNLSDTTAQNIHDIVREFLIAHVNAHPADYGNLDPGHDPTWNS